jgi:predicted 3-demethylubiquinone-9 3-methyltransferase (glyoxalase superfamily)
MLFEGTQQQRNRMSNALLQMKKIDIAALEKAFAHE